MKIGVVSDTHGYVPNSLHEVLAGVDRIVHAVDVGSYAVVVELQLIAPMTGVLGNNDFDRYGGILSPRLSFEAEGVSFLVAHRQRDTGWPSSDADIVICGHTHMRSLVERDGRYLLNPGSTTYPRGGLEPSVCIVEVSDGQILGFDFREL